VTAIASSGEGYARRAQWIAAAGWSIIALATGAAALPLTGPAQGALVIGGMLILAGLTEASAALLRRKPRILPLLAAAITVIAGLLFTSDQATRFAPVLIIAIGWLFLRSLILAIACAVEYGSVRFWTGVAAAADFILAFLLVVGFSASALVISLFGPTQPMVAHFAWILAISFVATGSMLLAVARCARRGEA
jgi:hypothetical protein